MNDCELEILSRNDHTLRTVHAHRVFNLQYHSLNKREVLQDQLLGEHLEESLVKFAQVS